MTTEERHQQSTRIFPKNPPATNDALRYLFLKSCSAEELERIVVDIPQDRWDATIDMLRRGKQP